MWGPGVGRWWTSGCICRRNGHRMLSVVGRQGCRRRGGSTGARRRWRWRCWKGRRLVATSRRSGWLGIPLSGCRPCCGREFRAAGMHYVLDVRPDLTVWPLEPAWTNPSYQGMGRPRQPRLRREERQTMAQRSLALPAAAWREITIAMGSQGPRTYRYSAQRVRVTRQRKPGEVLWAIYRQNTDGSEPRYYLSNAPEDTPLETLAHVGGSRWRIETESETEKSDVGSGRIRDPQLGGVASPRNPVPVGWRISVEFATGLGEKDASDHPAAGVPGGAGDAAPGAAGAWGTAAVVGRGTAAQPACQPLSRQAPRRPTGHTQTTFINPSL